MKLVKGEVKWRIPKAQGWSPEQYIATKFADQEAKRVDVGLWIMRSGIMDTLDFLNDRIETPRVLIGSDLATEYFHEDLLIKSLWPMMTALTAVTSRRFITHPVVNNRSYMDTEERRQGSEIRARDSFEQAWLNLVHGAPSRRREQDRFEGLLEVLGNGVYHLTYAMRPLSSAGPVVPKTTQPPLDYV